MSPVSTTVSFELTSLDDRTEISLDDEYNRTVYQLNDDETKSTFAPSEIAYLKLLPSSTQKPYTLGSSLGNLGLANSGIVYDYEEDINFILENKGELSFIPYGSVSYRWIGNDGGTPSFADGIINLPSDVIGILRCTYTVLGDRLKLTNADFEDNTYGVLCLAIYSPDDITSMTVNFDRGVEPSEVFLEVQVVDMCTGDPVPNALVQVEGIDSGYTDDDGLILLNQKVVTGQEYDIRVTADDYVSTDLDFIRNDSFTIPIIKEDEE